MNITIIELGIMHLDDCIILDQKALKGLWTSSQWEKELKNPKRICLGALEIDTKRILGICSAWFVLDELNLSLLAVDPLYFRRGIATFLLSNLIKQSKLIKINQVFLEVKDSNQPAMALYESMGFSIEGHRANFYKDRSNALIYTKKLTH